MKNSRLLAMGLFALVSLAGCGGVVDEPTGESPVGRSEAALSAEAEQGQGQEERGKPCRTTAECPNTGFFICTTEDGVCNPPPGCNPEREICPAICFGTCEPTTPPPSKRCGDIVCPQGTRCCNPLQSICVPPGFGCIF
jgi:hypothetical protein